MPLYFAYVANMDGPAMPDLAADRQRASPATAFHRDARGLRNSRFDPCEGGDSLAVAAVLLAFVSSKKPWEARIFMSAVANEQTKLLATAINNVAVSFVVIGFVTPVVALSFSGTGSIVQRVENVVFALAWLCTGFVLRWTARRILRGIKP